MKKIKGQISVELLTIVGFVLFLFIPIILISLSKSNEIEGNSVVERETYILREIATGAEAVFLSAEGTSVKIRLFFPESVKRIGSSQANQGSYLIIEDSFGNSITQYVNARVEVSQSLDSDAQGIDNLGGYNIIRIDKVKDPNTGENKVVISRE